MIHLITLAMIMKNNLVIKLWMIIIVLQTIRKTPVHNIKNYKSSCTNAKKINNF